MWASDCSPKTSVTEWHSLRERRSGEARLGDETHTNTAQHASASSSQGSVGERHVCDCRGRTLPKCAFQLALAPSQRSARRKIAALVRDFFGAQSARPAASAANAGMIVASDRASATSGLPCECEAGRPSRSLGTGFARAPRRKQRAVASEPETSSAESGLAGWLAGFSVWLAGWPLSVGAGRGVQQRATHLGIQASRHPAAHKQSISASSAHALLACSAKGISNIC